MRISDWSSDVCSSDLMRGDALPQEGFGGAHRLDLAMLRIEHFERAAPCEFVIAVDRPEGHAARAEAVAIEKVTAARRRVREHARDMLQLGRAWCRESVCRYVRVSVGAVSLKKK